MPIILYCIRLYVACMKDISYWFQIWIVSFIDARILF